MPHTLRNRNYVLVAERDLNVQEPPQTVGIVPPRSSLVNTITGFFETKRGRSLVEHRDTTESREITRPYPAAGATALSGSADAYFII
jgi:hypothetical protein